MIEPTAISSASRRADTSFSHASDAAHLQRIREQLARTTPMTDDEIAEFNTLRAREMRRAEARRQPVSPQLDLPEAA